MLRRMLIASAGLALLAGPALAQDFYDPNITVHAQTETDSLPPELRMREAPRPLFQADPLDRFVTATVPAGTANSTVEPATDEDQLPENLAEVTPPPEPGVDMGTTAAVGPVDPRPTVNPSVDNSDLPANLAEAGDCYQTATGEIACATPPAAR